MTNDSDLLNQFAATISPYRPGFVTHRPEPWAKPMACFQNVREKITRDKGRGITGWTFLSRISPVGQYLMATHHAVWCPPASRVPVDITPFHTDIKHRAYSPRKGNILFLFDERATPEVIGRHIIPRPMKFYPENDGPELVRYIAQMTSDELTECGRLRELALRDVG